MYQFLIAVVLKEKHTINSRDKNKKIKHPNEIGVCVLDYKYSFLCNKSARCYLACLLIFSLLIFKML